MNELRTRNWRSGVALTDARAGRLEGLVETWRVLTLAGAREEPTCVATAEQASVFKGGRAFNTPRPS
jgi:hypothetical protein